MADECVIRAEKYQLDSALTYIPTQRNGGNWAASLTDLDVFVMNFNNLLDNEELFGDNVIITPIIENPKNKNHYEENDIYKVNISGIGMEKDLTIDVTCTYTDPYIVVTLKRISGNERVFKKVCGHVEKMMTGKEYTNNNNNNNNGRYNPFGRYRRGGRKTRRKTRRSRHSCRHRKTKSRRSRK